GRGWDEAGLRSADAAGRERDHRCAADRLWRMRKHPAYRGCAEGRRTRGRCCPCGQHLPLWGTHRGRGQRPSFCPWHSSQDEGEIMIDGSLLQKIDFAKQGGLIPAIVQDAENGQVLMLAYLSAESL